MVLQEPTTTLANQCGPQQYQRPLGRVPLMTMNKDVALQHASQSAGAAFTSRQLMWSAQQQPVF
jgi:hypothetical protein